MIVAIFAAAVTVLCAIAVWQSRHEEHEAERQADRDRMLKALRRMGE